MFRRTRFGADDYASWNEAFRLYRGQLHFYLDYLIDCRCAENILSAVEADVLGTHVPDDFKLRFMVRSLARRAIQHLRECSQCGEIPDRSDPASWSNFPAQERLVYFL